MQFRTVYAKSKGVRRQYGQIVESYRRESDGMPMHRVLGTLGVVSDLQAATLKAAFAALRAGADVHVLTPDVLAKIVPTVTWSRDLGNVAACLQAWRDSGLAGLLAELFVGHEEDVEPADVVAALVVQRCVEPASKLAACRWFPQTALPELLGVAPAKFYNTRIHRVLERLESADRDLQNALSHTLAPAGGRPCTAFFMDCTDTWFTGDGPPMARSGKTKEGFYRKKIGIVLLCRDDGMPLRFKVVQGNTDDGVAMLGLLGEMGAEAWLRGAPVVADRALGNTADLLTLIAWDLQFVTALVAGEHAAYGATVDCPGLLELDHTLPDCLERAAAEVVKAGMTRHADDLFLLDLAVVQRDAADRAATAAALGDPDDPQRQMLRGQDLARETLAQARSFRQAVRDGKVASYETIRRGIGRARGHMHRIVSLLKLPEDVQSAIDAGAGRHLSKHAIVRICQGRDHAVHRREFARECAQATAHIRSHNQPNQPPHDHDSPWLQLVVTFNPQIWRHKREDVAERVVRVCAVATKQNQRLAATTKPISVALAQAEVMRALAAEHLTSMYQVQATHTDSGVPLVQVVRDDVQWRAARCRDGFHVIAASADVNLTALQRVQLYRSKDQVEKDFRDIKSVLELRPVNHRADVKVRAHVTLCVLALAVQRWQKQQLVKAGHTDSAEAALQMLRTLRLTGLQMQGCTKIIAAPTMPTAQQREIATALGVAWTLDAKGLAGRLKIARD